MKKAFIKIFLLLIIASLSSLFYIYQEEPDFLLKHFYERIYSDRLEEVPKVLLNETPVDFNIIEKDWSIQKNNGQWYTPPWESDNDIISDHKLKPVASAVSHYDNLSVIVEKEPDQLSLKITEAGSGQVIMKEQAALQNLPLPERNGNFVYELTMVWNGGDSPYRGKYVLEIPVTADLPEKFVFSAQRLIQGQLLEITVYYAGSPEDVMFEQSVYDKFKWFQKEGILKGYLPTNYNVKPGVYPIKYGIKSKGTEFLQEIEIEAYNYHIQYLRVDTQTEKETRNEAAYAEYYKYYTPVRNQSKSTRYYTESFLLPVTGILTTEFGETRYVNDLPTSYRHLGLDIAAPAGTGVKAANRGKVVLARSLMLTGNTVMIDHGEGLFSVYHHMRTLFVKTGDMAERGQKIGEVGSTGFSTGPHLHFMISYYTMNLEPGYFLFGRPVTYENYQKLIQ